MNSDDLTGPDKSLDTPPPITSPNIQPGVDIEGGVNNIELNDPQREDNDDKGKNHSRLSIPKEYVNSDDLAESEKSLDTPPPITSPDIQPEVTIESGVNNLKLDDPRTPSSDMDIDKDTDEASGIFATGVALTGEFNLPIFTATSFDSFALDFQDSSEQTKDTMAEEDVGHSPAITTNARNPTLSATFESGSELSDVEESVERLIQPPESESAQDEEIMENTSADAIVMEHEENVEVNSAKGQQFQHAFGPATLMRYMICSDEWKTKTVKLQRQSLSWQVT